MTLLSYHLIQMYDLTKSSVCWGIHNYWFNLEEV